MKLIASLLVCSFLTVSTRAQVPGQTSLQSQNSFQGSVPPPGNPVGPLSLSLEDAIQRGLRYNLALLLGDQSTRSARAAELRARAQLLPDLSGRLTDTYEQVNLAAFGFSFSFPGVSIPKIVGPFNVFDARATLSQKIFDLSAIHNRRAAGESAHAAELSQRDARDIVVQLVASGYLQVIADGARVDEAQSEVTMAQTLYQRALDMKNSGLTPAIDALRAQVELQSQQTRLRGLQNDRAKDLLALARLIGIPLEQTIILTDRVPYAPLAGLTPETAFSRALQNRSDYQAASAQVRAAELSRRAAVAERLPDAAVNADYGTIGPSPWNNHGTFTLTGSVRFSIFDSGRIRSDIEQADAALEQRKAEAADLRQRIDLEVRNALLDLQTAADQVAVATSSENLARQALTQAQDRFAAGVADNLEIVQAQNALTQAADTHISAVYAHNFAKVALARSLGVADQAIREFLGGK